jgi:hypothetical protein
MQGQWNGWRARCKDGRPVPTVREDLSGEQEAEGRRHLI